MKSIDYTQIIGSLLIVSSMILFAPLYYSIIQQKMAVASVPGGSQVTSAPVLPADALSGHPVRINVPSISLNLPVIDGHYSASSGDWTLTDYATQYAVLSMLPNDSQGNTLIYGHNTNELFRNLQNITPGAEASVETAEGITFVYQYLNSEIVNPTDTSVFQYQGSPRLTLQTCKGRFQQDRHLYYFTLVRTEQ